MTAVRHPSQNQPFYGLKSEGWFLPFRCYTNYVQLQFLKGTSLDPMPPKASKHDEVRYRQARQPLSPAARPGTLPAHVRVLVQTPLIQFDATSLSIWIQTASSILPIARSASRLHRDFAGVPSPIVECGRCRHR
jgi:hypothetical protein